MPTYEFRCRTCGATFTEARPMSASSEAASCPEGHSDTVRLLGVSGVVRSTGSSAGRATAPASGGCCGGGCCG